jgi:hypothetical protein
MTRGQPEPDHADGQVDQENAAPSQALYQHAADYRPGGQGNTTTGSPPADGPAACSGIFEHLAQQ